MTNFVSRSEFLYEDNVILKISQGTAAARSGNLGLLLDLDVIWLTDEGEIGQSEALKKAIDLRDRERDAFERHITDTARNLFDAA